jgi:hypothetical protein
MARWVLEHGADPNPRYEGMTLLVIAQQKQQSKLVEFLCLSVGLKK